MEPSLIGWEWHTTIQESANQPMLPQWSPALSAGNGRPHRSVAATLAGAAMEPSLIGWEWVPGTPVHLDVPLAAMEPSLIGWEWAARCCGRLTKAGAAMEPSLIGWEWSRLCKP